MKTARIILLVITITAKICCAQTVSTLMGARTAGLGNTSAALSDVWSGHNNPAGLGWFQGRWVAAASDRNPSMIGANRLAATAGVAGKHGGLSVGAFKFGDDLYNEQLASLSYAHKLGIASIGSRVEFVQYRTEGFEPFVTWGATLGTRAQITDQVAVGGYATNINRPRFPDGRAIPVRVAAGFSWKPTNRFLLCSEIEKISDTEPIIKSAAEFSPLKKVRFRTGFNLFPYAVFAGFGIRTWKISIDYAMSFSHTLSQSHQVSIELSSMSQEE